MGLSCAGWVLILLVSDYENSYVEGVELHNEAHLLKTQAANTEHPHELWDASCLKILLC